MGILNFEQRHITSKIDNIPIGNNDVKHWYFTIEARIGSNQDIVPLVLDTDSQLAQVFGTKIQCDLVCYADVTYDSAKSTTIQRAGKNSTIHYGYDAGTFLHGDNSFGGKFILGGYDEAKLDGEFSWSPYTNKMQQFSAQFDYMVLNGKKITVNLTKAIDSALDDANYGIGQVNCTALEGKTVTLSINGKELEVPLKSLAQPSGSGDHCYASFHKSTDPTLGTWFFGYVQVSIDFDNSLIGFSQLKNTNTTDTNIVPF
ncbi:unnamed protein product [Candida verbasci]|uniref:Peptidase A1 domain-containing protein n=1 Tax=Candida verbasci TaxID=1227364 RepID=A0A9W4XH64_9ASCO|nr:unnamed protein product [Candida verbasci]